MKERSMNAIVDAIVERKLDALRQHQNRCYAMASLTTSNNWGRQYD
jgi:hypothetical protein